MSYESIIQDLENSLWREHKLIQDRDKLLYEIKEWKDKYLEARLSGYQEGLEEKKLNITYKKGDRVKIYGGTERISTDAQNGYSMAYRRGDKGEVDFIVDTHEISVLLDKGDYVIVHPKQCRKLKKKNVIWNL